ncbi:DUF6519 domain-containing protein [Nodosilinea sp. P-1105]|uniref:DUF6519 domain-containing protein n=1 Tax=Nodosilinea sp. P-1105 TaxID=2546229 RepID=UPI00146AEE8A|nr:DUF6519 domain-containing protein [Nodosilinea sp. P-1105]NMF85086.1 tail fiber domain-containing protein [Nodosilinea sp. P-1105]
MAGDITRSTFDPKKGYTSVRMQQGRLQLDADWNEQADIQNHLRRAYVTDMIGAGSGASKVDPFTGDPSDTSFQLRAIATPPLSNPSATDIALLPGHFYTRGVLCELAPESSFTVRKLDNQRLQVSPSLTIDGRRLRVGDWLMLAGDEGTHGTNSTEPSASLIGWRIKKIIDQGNREIQVDGALDDVTVTQMRRIVTYTSQPDYLLDEESEGFDRLSEQRYFAYLDVWERPVTAVDDPTLRDVALNVPDTTTRTKTVWQLKLRQPDETIQVNQLQVPAAIATDWPQPWRDFEQAERDRAPRMNACARLCPDGTTGSNGRLGNYLYRVEIHHGNDPVTSNGNGNGNGNQAVTFKWSRNNGSVVSPVKAIEGNVIRISKSSQDAWADSTPGQWLELLTAAQELRGEPGLLVPLRSATDTKLEFDDALIVGGSIPKNVSKVRRWDHTVTDTRQGVLAISSNWIELENGIKVQFAVTEASEPAESDGDTASDQAAKTVPIIYRTGDYWLIPARAATNDIEWPSDRADDDVSNQGVSISRPIPQPPHGIEHQYALLAVVDFTSEDSIPKVYDQRILFPPLLRALDREGGEIAGDLEIRGQFSVMGLEADPETEQKADTQAARLIVLKNGNVGVGKTDPQSALDVEGTIRTTDLDITGEFFAETFQGQRFEVLLQPDNDESGTQEPVRYGVMQASTTPDGQPSDPKQIQFVAEPETSFVFLNGPVGIGLDDPQYPLEINGATKLELGTAINEFSTDDTLHDRSDDAVPTEKAVKTYVDHQISDFDDKLANKANLNGDDNVDFRAQTLSCRTLELNAFAVDAISNDESLGDARNNALPTEGAVKGYVIGQVESLNNSLNDKADQNGDENVDFKAQNLSCLSLNLNMAQINAISEDGILQDLRHDTLPTEGAVKTYVDSEVEQLTNSLDGKADQTGSNSIDFSAKTLSCMSLNLNSAIINEISGDDIPEVGRDDVLVTEQALTAYVDGRAAEVNDTLSQKASLNGDSNEDFRVKTLQADRLESMNLVTTTIDGHDVLVRHGLTSSNYYQISSGLLKDNISEFTSQEVAENLSKLHPVKFNYKSDRSSNTHAGFIAEEVPDLLASDDHQKVKLMDVIALLTKAVQEHRHVVKQLSAKVKKQDQEIAQLKQTLSNIIPPDS